MTKLKSNRTTTLIIIVVLSLIVSITITLSYGGRNIWIYLIQGLVLYIYYDISSKYYANSIHFLDENKVRVMLFEKPFKLSEKEFQMKNLVVEVRVKSFTKVNVFYLLTAREKNGNVAFRMTTENLLWDKSQIDRIEEMINGG